MYFCHDIAILMCSGAKGHYNAHVYPYDKSIVSLWGNKCNVFIEIYQKGTNTNLQHET